MLRVEKVKPMDQFNQELLKLRPLLTAFARKLTRDLDQAEDLVQDTLVRAIQARDRYTMGTNMDAWAVTIMRRHFLSECRKASYRKMMSTDDPTRPLKLEGVPGNQLDHMELKDVLQAMRKLPEKHAKVLWSTGVEGEEYKEYAAMAGIAVGTVRSRVSLARAHLRRLCT